ncbi:MAG: cytochrome c [Gemmatimonadetes bacterium]|nr:cytochrome c [Gemmatimonadota bacterium]
MSAELRTRNVELPGQSVASSWLPRWARQLRAPRSALRVLAYLALTTSACTSDQWQRFPSPDDVVAKVPWFSTMRRGLAVQPYSVLPREPVPGTVPITGGEVELRVDRESDLPAIARMRNPVPNTSESLNRGKELWGIYCYPCHGVEGRGDGPVAPVFVRPPDFLGPRVTPLNDGYVYAVIRFGRGLMPLYGDKVRGIDRWHLVNYVMALHGAQPRPQ